MPKTKRIKAQSRPPISNDEEFRKTVSNIAFAVISSRAIQAQYDEKIARLREECKAKTAFHDQVVKTEWPRAKAYAQEHRETLFENNSKTGRSNLAHFGFRKGQPKLVTLAKWTWKKVTQYLQDEGLEDRYCKTTVKPDKDALLRDLKKGEKIPGLKITQDEEFWIEPIPGSEDEK